MQIIQNKVARVVTKLDWSTSTAVLLNQVCWLSVNQLIFYHSVLQIYKVNKAQTPKYLDSMFSWTYIYNTRQAVGGVIRLLGKPRLELPETVSDGELPTSLISFQQRSEDVKLLQLSRPKLKLSV